MDAQQFVAEFGHIANAPGGIDRLRELIYQFAVTGRLAPQKQQEGSAGDVLMAVAETRKKLIAKGEWKRTPKLESTLLNPPAITLPHSWSWSRLLDLGEINPRNTAPDEDKATFVPMAGVSEKHSSSLLGEEAKWSDITKGYTHFANGDVILAKITPCFENGKAAFITGLKYGIGAGSTEFHVFRAMHAAISPAYIYLFLRSPLFRVNGQANMTGTAGQKRLPTYYFALSPLPLPPTGEQNRIVAKVDELMALCDKLETQQLARESRKAVLAQALLTRFAEEPTQANLHSLFHSSRAITPADLRKAILSLAVKGKLVSQDPSDEPAISSLAQIEKEKSALIEARKLRPFRLADSTKTRELQYPLPKSWRWFLLGEVVFFQEGPGIRNWQFTKEGVKLLNVQNIVDGKLILDNTLRHVSIDEFNNKYKHFSVEDGDILFASSGASWGKTAIFRDPGYTVMLNTSMIRLNFYSRRCDDSYLLNFLRTEFFARQMTIQLAGIQPNFGSTHLGCVFIPIPPVAEQRRIAAKVDELMALVDKLETQLTTANTVGKHLVETVVSALTGITTSEEQDLTVKAPPTELIASLRLGRLPDIKQQAPLATELARHQGSMAVRDLWQRFGGDIDAFYAQLKIEVTNGWILEPAVAEMRTKQTTATDA
jgi:type I restriction enzyme, S subunit